MSENKGKTQVAINVTNDDVRLLDDGTVLIDNPEFAEYIKTSLGSEGEGIGMFNFGNCAGITG